MEQAGVTSQKVEMLDIEICLLSKQWRGYGSRGKKVLKHNAWNYLLFIIVHIYVPHPHLSLDTSPVLKMTATIIGDSV